MFPEELVHLGETIFIRFLYGIVYFTSIKKFVVPLEKDCFDQVVFKWFQVFKHFL